MAGYDQETGKIVSDAKTTTNIQGHLDNGD